MDYDNYDDDAIVLNANGNDDDALVLAVEYEQKHDVPPIARSILDNMVVVEGGTFTMGADDQDAKSENTEKPSHSVTVSSFSISKYEVTRYEWRLIMGVADSENPKKEVSEKPVVMVSWDDCQRFISKLNALSGKKFRLPTEAEWEFAARGGVKGGSNFEENDKDGDLIWSRDKTDSTKTVGQSMPNSLGLYDMQGNVWEWCQDWWGKYNDQYLTNPFGPDSGRYRVLRGGSWMCKSSSCRITSRTAQKPNFKTIDIGFRLAL